MRVRDTVSLDEIIAIAELVDDPKPWIADEINRQADAGEIDNRTYLLRMGAYCLALAVFDEVGSVRG